MIEVKAEVTIIEPNITKEESDENFKQVEAVLELIANDLIEKELRRRNCINSSIS